MDGYVWVGNATTIPPPPLTHKHTRAPAQQQDLEDMQGGGGFGGMDPSDLFAQMFGGGGGFGGHGHGHGHGGFRFG